MGVAAKLAPKGLGSQNSTKKLVNWAELLLASKLSILIHE